jgi:vacuolar-type H+-ATPase subunit I/STV1
MTYFEPQRGKGGEKVSSMQDHDRIEVLEQFERQTAHKATIAWGLAIGLEDDIRQIKVDINQLKIEMQRLRDEHGKKLDEHGKKLDQILALLQPGR